MNPTESFQDIITRGPLDATGHHGLTKVVALAFAVAAPPVAETAEELEEEDPAPELPAPVAPVAAMRASTSDWVSQVILVP